MSYQTIELVITDGVARLTLNRPEVMNALNQQIMEELRSALDAIAADDQVGALLLTGSGKGFCAGADLAALGTESGDATAHGSVGDAVAAAMYANFNRVITKLWEMPKPVVTAINGVAAGGGIGLALTADVTIAARSASFVSVFGPKLGIVPDMGTTWHLQRLVGRARALGMAVLGDRLSGERAAEWGLVYRMVDDEQLSAAAAEIAASLAAGPRLAFPRIREALAHAETATLAEQLGWEAEAQRVLCSTEDFAEGVSAFLQKRPGQFKGR